MRVVYEDQGPPFVLKAGDCLIQPPRIRHRVLESSANLEVIEVSTKAQHLTTMDHEMELPTGVVRTDRDFSGQRFCRSEADQAIWTRGELPGFETRETGIGAATGGLASVHIVRATGRPSEAWTTDTAGILFCFIRSGHMTLRTVDHGHHVLQAEDALVVPPGMSATFVGASPDLEVLKVALSPQVTVART